VIDDKVDNIIVNNIVKFSFADSKFKFFDKYGSSLKLMDKRRTKIMINIKDLLIVSNSKYTTMIMQQIFLKKIMYSLIFNKKLIKNL